MKFRRFFFLSMAWLASLFVYSNLAAQNQYVPKIVPPSPNAASITKFTELPVSTYTGTANISIPIFTAQGKGITVPVSLDYHTGGIRLKEEAGWVGLGWALNAGGVISRTILDKEDFGTNGTYFTSNVTQYAGDIDPVQQEGYKLPTPAMPKYYFDFFCNYKVITSGGTMDYYPAFTQVNSPYDVEPDIYNYSFPGHSGKFILTRDRKVVFEKQENIKVSFENSGNSFTILDEQGNKYLFADLEWKMSATGALSTQAISSWYLSRIISQQNDTLNFSYFNDNTWTSVAGEIYDNYTAYCSVGEGFFRGNDAGTWYTNRTLQAIDFSSGRIQFSFDNNRSDLKEARKLNNIQIYSKKPGGLEYLKEYKLFYSYFNSIVTGIDTLEYRRLKLDSVRESSVGKILPPYSFTYNDPNSNQAIYAKHSFGVDHWGFANGAAGNTSYIPSINCYYNPLNAGGGNPLPDYFGYTGANREPDPSGNFTKAFSLLQVKYPEGGKTVIETELNEYDRQQSINGPVDFPYVSIVNKQLLAQSSTRGTTTGSFNTTHITPIPPAGSQYSNAQLTIVFRGAANYRNVFGKIYFQLNGPSMSLYEDITTNNLSCDGTSYVCSVTLPLTIQATTYNWTIFIDPSVGVDFQEVRATLYFNEEQSYNGSVNNNVSAIPGGGLRIKTITDYSQENLVAKKRTYDYSYFQDKDGNGVAERNTYGRLMALPSYVRYSMVGVNGGGVCTQLILSGSSYASLTSVSQGNIVGYDQVTESVVDATSGVDNGKTIYKYYNVSDTAITHGGYRLPGTQYMGNALNGSLLNKIIYSNAGSGVYNKVAESFNYYRTANRSVYFSPKYQNSPRGVTPGGGNCIADTAVQNEVLACFYPSIKSEKILLDSTKEITYDQSDPNKFITSTTRFYYDNPLHYQQTRARTTDSKGNSNVSFVKYPQDYIPNGQTVTGNTILDSLIRRNMVAAVIEKRDSLYLGATGYVAGAVATRYKFLTNNSLGLDKQFQLDIAAPVTDFQGFAVNGNTISQDSRYRQMISFEGYTNTNDIQQFTATDGLPNAYIWDYFKNFPVAKISNALASDVAYTSFEADGNGNWSVPDTVRNYANSLTGIKSYSLVTGKTVSASVTSGKSYIVSYWSRNGAVTVKANSVTIAVSTTGVTKNGWTYYEHLLPSTTTAVTVTATSAILDELRLYPLSGHMATFTYKGLYGISSTCDETNHISTYEYDSLGRLLRIRDFDGNIIKTFQYYYKNQANY